MRSNEKPCICNAFATSHSKNPVKSSVPSYANVNFSSQRDNLTEYQKNIKTLGNSVFSRVFFMSEFGERKYINIENL